MAAALLVEFGALFALWDWSRFRAGKALAIGCLGAIVFVILLCAGAPVLSGRIITGYFGMYIFSALSWAWWRDGVDPAEWNLGEVLIAFLAAGLFSIAATPT